MPLDFPSNPINGQIYDNYYYDTQTLSWRSSPLTNGPAYISDIIPSGAPNGGIWYNSTDGTLFVKYLGAWVEARSNPKIIPGSIVQTIQATKTGTFATTSTSFVSVSGLSASITPKFSNSKIMLSFSSAAGHNGHNLNFFTFLRDGVNVVGGTQAIQGYIQDGGTAVNQAMNVSMSYIDSPTISGSPIAYTVGCRTDSNTMYVGDRPAGSLPTMGTLIVMEVAQ